MGLDMYLEKRTHVKNWNHTPEEERYDVSITRGSAATTIQPERIKFITEEVAYWRKANAIHGWFVNNCQGGVDECQETFVSRDQLQELLDDINQVLDVPEGPKRDKVASEVLPPTPGFFFGSYELDDEYYNDLNDTKETLTNILAEPDPEGGYVQYIYQSSW